jgi:hypothetical protein
MSHVTAKVASRFLIGVAAAAVSMALPSPAARAADGCLTEPGGDNPQGRHWYYRIERGTGRHCWYLRAQDDKSARADEDKVTSGERSAPRKIDAATSRSIADAHAELATKTAPADSANTPAAPSVWPGPPALNAASSSAAPGDTPADTTQDPSSATRWPQQTGQADPAAQPEASLLVADAQPDATADSRDMPPPPPPAERNIGSIQKLALVAVGALTLAGLTGSAVYRLGRRRQRNEWLRERAAWQYAQGPSRPPWVDEPRLYHSDPTVADLDETPAEAPSDLALAANEGNASFEQIEDYLTRLTRQLHEELEGARPHRA